MFDTDTFMNSSVEGEMSTRMAPVPENEYPAQIVEVIANVVGMDKDKPVLDVQWEVLDPALEEEIGRVPRSRQRIFLDITDSGSLDLSKGKNTGLGRLREAVGQNNSGAWSPNDLIGAQATVSITHRMWEGEVYDEVKRVAAPE